MGVYMYLGFCDLDCERRKDNHLAPCIHSAFFSDGTKLQGTGISNSFGKCDINGIDESVKYGRLLVTHNGFIDFNSDGIDGRDPPRQIELSKRYD